MAIRSIVPLLALLLATSGCLDLFGTDDTPIPYTELGYDGSDPTGEDDAAWPDLRGVTLTILDAGSFDAFDEIAKQFQEVTGAQVAIQSAESPMDALGSLDNPEGASVVLGLDNMFLAYARDQGVLEAYEPLLAERVAEEHVFLEGWHATPFEHAYYAFQWAPEFEVEETYRDEGRNKTRTVPLGPDFMEDIFAARERADLVVVEDPRLGTPGGLAFLWLTIGALGDDPSFYDWQEYWRDLLASPDVDRDGVRDGGRILFVGNDDELVERHIIPALENNQSARPVAWMPTTVMPQRATAAETEAIGVRMLLEDRTTWHRTNTAALVAGTENRAAGQAFIEFLLTDFAQNTLAGEAATYPVIADGNTTAFGGLAPAPGSFRTAHIDPKTAGVHVADWLEAFDDLCATYKC